MVSDDLVYFFLSSACMIFIWNSIIIRTARNRGIGSYLLEVPCQSPMFPGLMLPWALLSLSSPTFYSFYRFLYTIFSLPFYFEVCFITSIFYCIMFLRRQSTHSYPHTSSVFRSCLTLSLCLTYIFIFHSITTCQARQTFSCLLLILTHVTLKWSKRKGCRQTIECFV